MNTATPDLQSLAARIEKLERQNRWMKRTAVAVIFIVAVVPFLAQQRMSRSQVAEQFVLRDAQGATAAGHRDTANLRCCGRPLAR